MKPDYNINVVPLEDKLNIHTYDNEDLVRFEVIYDPFRINIFINNRLVMEANTYDLLYFENTKID